MVCAWWHSCWSSRSGQEKCRQKAGGFADVSFAPTQIHSYAVLRIHCYYSTRSQDNCKLTEQVAGSICRDAMSMSCTFIKTRCRSTIAHGQTELQQPSNKQIITIAQEGVGDCALMTSRTCKTTWTVYCRQLQQTSQEGPRFCRKLRATSKEHIERTK